MPPLFDKKDFKIIEYGHDAHDDFSLKDILAFFGKILTFKTAK